MLSYPWNVKKWNIKKPCIYQQKIRPTCAFTDEPDKKGFYEPENNRAVSFAHAFYLATKAGGSVFGNVGSLEKGYRFNALVIESMEDKGLTLSPEERLERFCYTGDDRNIVARYLSGAAVE